MTVHADEPADVFLVCQPDPSDVRIGWFDAVELVVVDESFICKDLKFTGWVNSVRLEHSLSVHIRCTEVCEGLRRSVWLPVVPSHP